MAKDFYELLLENDNGEAAVSAVRSGLPVNSYDGNGFTPLYVAAMLGQTNVVDVLIAAGANVNLTSRDSGRGTPLHAAAQWGWKGVCQSLISAGASVRSTDGVKATPLHNAAGMGFAGICQLLLDQGADVSAKNKFKGATPLQVAVANGSHGKAEYALRELERDLASEGFRFPPREPQDPVGTVALLLRQGISRRDASKAAKWARLNGSDEMIRVLTFHGSR